MELIFLTFATIGGLWFAGPIFFIGMGIINVMMSERGTLWSSIFITVIAAVVLKLLFDFNLIAYVSDNPLITIISIFVYLALGCLYVVYWKWPKWLYAQQTKIENAYNKYIHDNPKSSKVDFVESEQFVKYRVENNKELLANWIFLWAFNAVWTLIRDPFKWIWVNLYAVIGKELRQITNNTIDDILKK